MIAETLEDDDDVDDYELDDDELDGADQHDINCNGVEDMEVLAEARAKREYRCAI